MNLAYLIDHINELIEEYLKEHMDSKDNCSGKNTKRDKGCCDVVPEKYESILDCICGRQNNEENIKKRKFKRHPHQYRMPTSTILAVNKLLQKERSHLQDIKDFDSLHDEVKSCIKKYNINKSKVIKGFGNLAIYDFSLRFGKQLGLYPDKVYVHAGTWDGAKALEKLNVLKTIIKNKNTFQRIPILQFYESGACEGFKKLNASQIEDFLCVYHKFLEELTEK